MIVRSSLNGQRISSYSLTLIASDNNSALKSHTGSIQLNIHIINESIPVFIRNVYHIDIREDILTRTNLLKIEAINDDNINKILNESPFLIDRLT